MKTKIDEKDTKIKQFFSHLFILGVTLVITIFLRIINIYTNPDQALALSAEQAANIFNLYIEIFVLMVALSTGSKYGLRIKNISGVSYAIIVIGPLALILLNLMLVRTNIEAATANGTVSIVAFLIYCFLSFTLICRNKGDAGGIPS